MTQQEVIKRFMGALDTTTKQGGEALDEAIKACSTFNSFQELKTAIINDCTNADIEDFLKTYCGIILDNDDTGAITGSDASNGKVKNSMSIIPEEGEASYPSGKSFTKCGLKFIIPEKSTLTPMKQKIIQGLYSWWGNNSLALLEESYGYSFNDSDITVEEIEVLFHETYPYKGDAYAWVLPYSNEDEKTYRLTLNFNMSKFPDLIDEKNGISSTSTTHYLDLIIGHEMTHAIMAAKIKNFSYLPRFLKEGIADLTIGSDKTQEINIRYLSQNPSTLMEVLDNGYSGDYSYAAGYIFLRYMAKQSADSYVKLFTGTSEADNFETCNDGVTINGGGGDDSIQNGSYGGNARGGDSVLLDGGADNDYLYNMQGENVTMVGGAGNDEAHSYQGNLIHVSLGTGEDYFNAYQAQNVTVFAEDGADKLYATGGNKIYYDGGKDNDYIYVWNGAKNSTIIGGLDDDTINVNDSTENLILFKNGDGNDLITGFNETSTLSIAGSYSSIISGSDIIVTVGNGKITLQGAASLSSINIISVNPLDIVGTEGADFIENTLAGATINAFGGNDSIYNGSYVNNVSINGGNGNDSITNKGANVTIDAGADDDYIWNENSKVLIDGDSGNDKIYSYGSQVTIAGGAGNDTIGNNSVYATNSKIYGGNGNDSISNSGNSVSIVGGDGDDTIRNNNFVGGDNDGGGKNVTIFGGAGDDYIENSGGENVLFKYASGDGNDTIAGFNTTSTLQIGNGTTDTYSTVKSGSDIIVTVGTGKITLVGATSLSKLNIAGKNTGSSTQNLNRSNSRASTTLSGGAGDDTLTNWSGGKYSTINGWSGNDSIKNTAASVTIDGGLGDDSIKNSGANVVFDYKSGNGNDLIQGFRADSTLKIGGGTGSYSSTKSGSDVIVTVGTGKVTLQGAASLSKLNISGKSTSSSTQNLNRSNSKANIRFNGGAGDDTLTNWTGGKGSTINGWSGNDSIKNTAANVSINGGIGNDKIANSGANVTIAGGAGNDSLWGGNSADTFVYNNGDGRDIIYGFDNTDMLQIIGDWSATYYSGSGKILFKVGSTYSAITLQDFSASTFNINGTAYKISGNTLAKK